MFHIQNEPEKLTIYARTSGLLRMDEARTIVESLMSAVRTYGGRSHLFVADMRGLLPLAPDVAAMIGEGIASSRRNGTVLCVHLSDSAIIRLQAKRLVREISPQDSMTVDVVSLEEAEVALEEARRHIMSGGDSGIVPRLAEGRSRAAGGH